MATRKKAKAKAEEAKPQKPLTLESEPWFQADGDDAPRLANAFVQRLYSQQHEVRAQMARDCNALYHYCHELDQQSLVNLSIERREGSWG